jgi:hypothetical protein
MSDEDEGPGWEMQQDNEARRAEEEALERSRRLLAISRKRQTNFERDMQQLRTRISEIQEHAND